MSPALLILDGDKESQTMMLVRKKKSSCLKPLIWTVQQDGSVDIPAELWWITAAYLPQPPVSAKTPLSTNLGSVTETDKPKVKGQQQTGRYLSEAEQQLCF